MGLTYNITEDYLYQEGIIRGREEGKRGLIVEMLNDGTLTIEKIASLAKVSVEHVQQIEKELKK
jgi:predicted transposase YdaD